MHYFVWTIVSRLTITETKAVETKAQQGKTGVECTMTDAEITLAPGDDKTIREARHTG
jgi:hypothetical protein